MKMFSLSVCSSCVVFQELMLQLYDALRADQAAEERMYLVCFFSSSSASFPSSFSSFLLFALIGCIFWGGVFVSYTLYFIPVFTFSEEALEKLFDMHLRLEDAETEAQV